MKKSKNSLNEIDSLRDALSTLDERCPLPNSLRAEHVLQDAAPARRSYTAPLRRGLALAAALAVMISASVLVNRANLFTSGPYVALPTEEVSFDTSYYELEQAFLRMQNNRQRAWGMYDYEEMTMEETMEETMMPADMNAAMAAPGESLDGNRMYAGSVKRAAGETNTQVRGVDEADILKNDGEHLYYVQGGRLYIVQLQPELKVLTSLGIPNYRQNTELYVRENRMALVYSEYPPGGDPASSVQVYDIADREKPLLVKSFSQPGSLLSSRMIDGRVYLLSTQWANLDFRVRNGVIPEEDILPVVYNDSEPRMLPAGCISIMPNIEEPSYLLVSSLDVESSKSESENAAILGAGSQVYCNPSALFVACQQWQNSGGLMRAWGIAAKTMIYKFDLLPGGKIKSAGAGEAPGAPLNQFSMDEYRGYFRIATTGNRDRDGETVNFITILDGSLKQVGSIENIAPGERIQSARFLGGRGYIVTFREVDPLFAIDLEDPRNPKILGELKLPGFSAYLHPWDEKHLIGIGPGGDDRGTDGSTKVSLFDISDPARPIEADRVIIPRTWSEIQQNHKILTVCAEKGLFGLPLRDDYGGSSFYTFHAQGNRVTRSWTLDAVRSNNAREISPYYGYYYDGNHAMRGTYIGDTWYVLGTQGVAAYAMDSGVAAGSVLF